VGQVNQLDIHKFFIDFQLIMPKRARTSLVYTMGYFQDGEDGRIHCTICDKTYSHSSSSSDLKKHLKKHPEQFQEFNFASKTNPSAGYCSGVGFY